MTAGSWIYIGSQGIVQGTYEAFVEAARNLHDKSGGYGGTLKGKFVLTAGLAHEMRNEVAEELMLSWAAKIVQNRTPGP